jgi:biotin carboxyl carrier protein
MEGKGVRINVKVGDSVREDDEVLVMEAMKMEMPVTAPGAGVISAINIKEGEVFAADSVLMTIA